MQSHQLASYLKKSVSSALKHVHRCKVSSRTTFVAFFILILIYDRCAARKGSFVKFVIIQRLSTHLKCIQRLRSVIWLALTQVFATHLFQHSCIPMQYRNKFLTLVGHAINQTCSRDFDVIYIKFGKSRCRRGYITKNHASPRLDQIFIKIT